MVFILLLLPLLPFFLKIDLLSYLAEVALPLHTMCVNRLPITPYSDLYRALCCGARLPVFSPTWSIFRHLGLLHLLVVSGYHLIIIESVLRKIDRRMPRNFQLSKFILAIYAAICLFQPPVVRAFTQMLLRSMQKSWQLHWSTPLLSFMTGTVCLILFPQWLTSISFQLSWCASFIICLPLRPLPKCLAFYLGLWPILALLGEVHYLTILVQWLLASLAIAPLMVASWLVFIFPNFATLSDHFVGFILENLFQLSQSLPPPKPPTNTYVQGWIWIWVMGLFLVSLTWNVLRLRRLK